MYYSVGPVQQRSSVPPPQKHRQDDQRIGSVLYILRADSSGVTHLSNIALYRIGCSAPGFPQAVLALGVPSGTAGAQ